MAPRSSTLAWKSPWTEEAGRLESMGSQTVGHDRTPNILIQFTFTLKKMNHLVNREGKNGTLLQDSSSVFPISI